MLAPRLPSIHFQAYFISEIAPNNFNSKLKIIILHENNEMTGIKNIMDVPKENVIYDMSGRRIYKNQLQKGIYIINGKKQVFSK